METRKLVRFARPSQAPDGWQIYNAPRPLFGTINEQGEGCTWLGDFVCGIFYAAIDPADPDGKIWRDANERLHATRLEFVTVDEVVVEMVEYYKTRYAPERFDSIFSTHPLDDPETIRMLVDTWLKLGFNVIK